MDNIKEFMVDMSRFEASAQAEFVLLFHATALRILRGIVLKTPVDTGRARFNWQVEVDSFNDRQLPGVDRGGGMTIQRGASKIQKASPLSIIWIFNNLPYIYALEHGHSQQAPHGMVRPTLGELGGIL